MEPRATLPNRPRFAGRLARFVLALLLLPVFAGSARPVTAADFATGDRVVVDTAAVNVREGPGLEETVVAVLRGGDAGTVTGGPVVSDGYSWYALAPDDGPSGWVCGECLAPLIDTGFATGSVVVATTPLNLRQAPRLGAAVLAVLAEGASGSVLSGPARADGYEWYELTTAHGTGFAAGEFLAIAAGGESPVPGRFPIGSLVVVAADSLNLRDAPALSGTVIYVYRAGDPLTVVDGPVAADGYDWYAVRLTLVPYPTYTPSWVAGEFLTGGVVRGGDAVVSDGPLNLRNDHSLDAEVLAVLPQGAAVAVLAGDESIAADQPHGLIWVRVTSDYGAGWVASRYLSGT
jgi:uncharacterized protein YgiM (DUF1202 family)